jgi:hypothetical protein
MDKVTALEGQTLADIAIQETGTVEGLFELAMANAKSITDLPTAGEKLAVPEDLPNVREIADYYRARDIRPVTRIEEVVDNETLFDAGLFDPGLFD